MTALFLVVLTLYPRDSTDEAPTFRAGGDSMDLAVIDGIIQADRASTTPVSGIVRAVIVPHHLVASKSIALGIKALVPADPKVIVLISPDHYGKCEKLLCTTNGTFHTFFGDVDASDSRNQTILKQRDIAEDSPGLFIDEHGIYTIIPFIRHYLPNTKVIPIALSQKGVGSEQARKELLGLIEKILSQKDVALVVSSDFSHYLPLDDSNRMDAKTSNALCSGDVGRALHLLNPSQSDCPICLWVAMQTSKLGGFSNLMMIVHTNSATLLNDVSVRETTSHFTILFSTATADQSCPTSDDNQSENLTQRGTRLLFVGDMFFDRYIRQVSEKHGSDFVFSCIDPLLKQADVVVGNLEGPITPHPSTSEGTAIGSPENYQFTFPTTTASILKRHNVQIVNIGNNHIGNYGAEGIRSTHDILSAAGSHYFGGLLGDSLIYRTEIGGEKLSFVNYNQFGGDTADTVASLISVEHSSGRVVIVYAHWGDEYESTTPEMKFVAKLFATNGAALIIGSHPHIVLPHENIGETPAYYSLGNFIFDQYFDPRTTHGLTVMVNITNGKISTKEYPVILGKNGQTCPE